MDERIRELERAWQETGEVAAERAYLLARLRAGRISWVRVETAAYLGDAAAADLLGEDALALVAPASGVSDWFSQLPCARLPQLRRDATRAALDVVLVELPALAAEPPLAAGLAALDADDASAKAGLDRVERALESGVEDWTLRGLLQTVQSMLKARLEPRWETNPHVLLKVLEHARKRVDRGRQVMRDALYPRVLTEEGVDYQAEDEAFLTSSYAGRDREHIKEVRSERLSGQDTQLVRLGSVDPEVARETLAGLELPKKLKPDDGVDLFRAYALARGWAEKRGKAFVAPSGQKRLKLKKRSLALEVRRWGAWDKKGTWSNRTVSTVRAGEQLRAALELAAAR